MRMSSADFTQQQEDGEKRCLNSELWHACAGPLVSLPAVGSRVVYFPQGHSEQVAYSTNKEVDAQTPNYPSLPPQLVCQLHDVIMHADVETDEVYAQMTLQPLSPQEQKEIYLPAELGVPCKQPTNYFSKTLTASDTSTHGGFSVPRRAAEKVFPPLDFSQQPPAQELIARDLHDNEWKFRHIFRGQPKRHLLTTGWSVFVSAKNLVAGDSVLFIWNDNNQLLIGIRRASRPQTVTPSSVLSSDSMHLGLLAAAAHATSTNSRFTIFYNPRASPTEFVISLTKYIKAVYHTRVSVGMRFRMMFETEESSVRRYMGTITGISDSDPTRWPNSHWRSVKVGWDESTAGEKQPRVSLWEIEPLTTFPMYPPPFSLGMKRPWLSGIRDNLGMNRLSWFQGDNSEVGMQSLNFPGVGLTPYMQPRLDVSMLGLPIDMYQAMAGAAFQNLQSISPSRQPSSSHLSFQQPQPSLVPNSTSTIQTQVHSHSHPQLATLQNAQGSQHQFQHETTVSQSQALLQQQLQHSGMLSGQQGKQPQLHQQQHPHIPNLISSMPQFASSSLPEVQLPQSVPSLPHHRLFSECEIPASSTVNSAQGVYCPPLDDVSPNLLNLVKNESLISSTAWLDKRTRVEPQISPEAHQSSLPQLEFFNSSLPNTCQDEFSLPPFDGATALQDNLMFGVNLDSSSLLMQNKRLRTGGDNNIQFPTSNLLRSSAADYAVNSLATASNCTNGSELLHSPDNIGEEPHNMNFVKIHKSGSFGRSLDLAKFSSYQELRSELARMFGLEGQLEDPLRSGWQLVFIDKENDALLLGDDPWMEFVNSVSCIKILSPEEVQQMDPEGLELLSSVPTQKLSSNSNCEEYMNIQDPRNMNAGIPCIGTLEY